MSPDEVVPLPASALVSDGERDRVVEILKERTADGTLTLEEFAGRMDSALVARRRGELDALTADLRVPRAGAAARRQLRHQALAVMAGTRITGRWRCGDRVTAVAVMGGCHVDFRGAEIDADEVHVTAVAVMGGIDIVVPEGIEVTMGGLSVMGGRSMQVKDVPLLPGSPRIVVHALPIMGGVTVRSRPRHSGGSAEEIQEVVPQPRVEIPSALPMDGTVTVMFSDVCDYSGITDRLGDVAANELLREHTKLIREQIDGHGGFEVKSSGDGFMVAFTSVARAVRCAIGIQRKLADLNASRPGETFRVHIGIHAGEVVREGDDLLGSTVIVASRLADVAGQDEILVSSVARELAGGSREFAFEPARTVTLKGLVDARQAYPVRWQSEP